MLRNSDHRPADSPSVLRSDTPFTARQLLHLMALAREGDRREGILLRQGRGWFQVGSTGHETLAVLPFALRPDDLLFPHYRDRPIALARGVGDYELALAYFAKAASSSGGRQMPGHYSDRSLGLFSTATPTASQCLPAAGAAWGFQREGTGRVAVAMIGDAATRQGEFYEALAFAVQERLPLVFVVEDNRYGISTPTERMFPYRLGVLGEETLLRVDGRDPYALYDTFADAVQSARDGAGPHVVWCELDRLCSHTSSDDQRVYRPADDLSDDASRDPLARLARTLIDAGEMTEAEWEAELAEIAAQVDADYRAAEKLPDPDPDPLVHLHGPAAIPTAAPVELSTSTTMVSAVNETLRQALLADPRVLLFGEDIEDPKGGVFGLTKGLSREFGDRVVNAPLSEATIVGTAVGLAATGWKPVFEIQFVDFLLPAMNQLVTQVGNLRWRTSSDWACPMVLIAPYGAYLPGGSIWHSESNEGIWAHIHGLNVVVPGTPEDAAGMLWTAIHGNDPTLFLLPKHIFRKRLSAPSTPAPIPLGQAKVRRHGEHVTVVSFGNCLELADAAADRLASEGVEIEVIDLRSIQPLDIETIEASVRRTGRLVVVHEDARTTGIGHTIVAEMVGTPERFALFYAAPQVVARLDTYIGYNPVVEYAALPSLDQVLAAIRTTLE